MPAFREPEDNADEDTAGEQNTTPIHRDSLYGKCQRPTVGLLVMRPLQEAYWSIPVDSQCEEPKWSCAAQRGNVDGETEASK